MLVKEMEPFSPPSIVDEFDEGKFDMRPVEDRYYTRKYTCHDQEGDYMFLVHSNKLCVLKLAPSHPIIAENLVVTKINFQVSDGVNRLDNQIRGKGKKGAQLLNDTSVLCQIECEGRETPFKLRASMVAKLLEVNTTLVNDPDRIKTDHLSYLAIIAPRVSDREAQLSKLVTSEEYVKKLAG